MFKQKVIGARSVFSGMLLLVLSLASASAQAPSASAANDAVPKAPAAETLPKSAPKVVQVNGDVFAKLLKPKGKPLMVNFWATWCEPCREEFPEIVRLDREFDGRIDVITISLDFAEDINTVVPAFLKEMQAEMPAYLLVTEDETSAIAAVSKDWQGGLPFTVLYDGEGRIAYFRQGVIQFEPVRLEIEKLLSTAK